MTRCLVWAETAERARQKAQDEASREARGDSVPWEDERYSTCREVDLDDRERIIDRHRTDAGAIRRHGRIDEDYPDGPDWIDDDEWDI